MTSNFASPDGLWEKDRSPNSAQRGTRPFLAKKIAQLDTCWVRQALSGGTAVQGIDLWAWRVPRPLTDPLACQCSLRHPRVPPLWILPCVLVLRPAVQKGPRGRRASVAGQSL